MATVVFTLSMPNNNSWNGSECSYNIVKKFGRTKKERAKVDGLLEKGSFYYNFGDGWGASIAVEEVDAAGARKARKQSQGFCGYDWMVTSILRHGDIRT